MTRATIAFGLGLCAATILLLLNLPNGRITTVFVPMMFGIPIFIAGVISLNPHRRRWWLRGAVVLALIGGLGSLIRVGQNAFAWFSGAEFYPLPTIIATALTVTLLGFAVAMHLQLAKKGQR